MISPAAAELIRRGREQIANGIGCVLRSEYELAHVWFRSAASSFDALEALLGEPHRPMRKMALVAVQRPGGEEEADPEWFARKANDNPDGAA